MMGGSVKSRMLAVAVLPVTLVVLGIVLVFWFGRSQDMSEAHTQRSRLLARQVALASELGVFSGDLSTLQGIVNGVRREPDVVSAAVFDSAGVPLAWSGEKRNVAMSHMLDPQVQRQRSALQIDVLSESVVATTLPMDDLFSSTAQEKTQKVLGYVVLEVSRANLVRQELHTLWLALLLGAVGVLGGVLLALRMGRGVVEPVERVSRIVERIGHGDFSAIPPVSPADPFYNLQLALKNMALRLSWSRDELEQRVAHATQELLARKEEAELATRAKSHFLAAASHDLRQPTHALGLFVTRLGQLPMDAEARSVVANLEVSVLAMQDLLDGLLDLSRLDAGNITTTVAPFSVDEVLQSVREVLAPLASQKGLRLRVRLSGLWGVSDLFLLKRMVLNLGQNAVRYTTHGGILLAARPVEQGRSVRIDVWDTGIGIEQEHRDDVFKEFFQIGNRARDRRQGLGLGLSIVKRSAELLGHQVEVRSVPMSGSRFSIVLARTTRLNVALPQEAAQPGLGNHELGLRVLLIEDDPLAMESVVGLLDSWGCEVLATRSAQEACALIARGVRPDVLLSDYRLDGDANGIDCIAAVRAALGTTLPACLVSGDTDANLMQRARSLGLTLLHKPVRPAKLRSLLRSVAAQ
ncbi:MAG: response regulator [Burkholderiales bacterium]|nr:response regulator [Burkholderiales bacterium]